MKVRRPMALIAGAAMFLSWGERAPTAAVDFVLPADKCSSQCAAVAVAGTFNDWNTSATPMVRDGDVWRAAATLDDGRHEYKLVWRDQEGGTHWMLDPENPYLADNGIQGANNIFDVVEGTRKIPVEGMEHFRFKRSGCKWVAVLEDNGQQLAAECTVFVVQVNLETDGHDFSNPKSNGVLIAENQEEDPGAYLHRNVDNDNGNVDGQGNPIADQTENGSVTNENDLMHARIILSGVIDRGTVVLQRSNTNIRVWTNQTKGTGNELLVAANSIQWDLSTPAGRADFISIRDVLWVEGYGTGAGGLTVKYMDPVMGSEVCSDLVNYTPIWAACGRQPKPAERTLLQTTYPNLVDCEWNITGERTDIYNCYAWSVGITNEAIWGKVDYEYGDMDGDVESSDFDSFYEAYGYVRTTDPAQAEILLYKNPNKTAHDNPEGITHAARATTCSCGAGKWDMFESKCGNAERLEHVRDQLNGTTGPAAYGEPYRYYKQP